MPGFTTHYLFGLNTWKKLDNIPLKQVIQNNHAAYSLGLQGPDLFFYFLQMGTADWKRFAIFEICHAVTDFHNGRL